MNKTIQNQLAPGSTFKIIMSLAGLQEGVAQSMHVQCNGGGTFYGRFFACDKHHGSVDIEHAIPWSCDTFYYTLAEKLGIDTIAKYANSVGIGVKTGIDLPEEAAGTMPSTAWKMKTQHQVYYPGEVISVGIGQGPIQASPLQIARAISGIASGGALKRPHVVFPDELSPNEASAVVDSFPGAGDKQISLTTENWQLITDAMAQTMINGTAAEYVRLPELDVAGKTGTAQVVNHSAGATSLGTGNERANAWFVGMVPRRNPDIVVAVLLEHGGWGGSSAPLAAQVLTTFVNKQRKKDNNLRIAETPPAKPVVAVAGTAPAAE
jgi:penicillin-binding protein 2